MTQSSYYIFWCSSRFSVNKNYGPIHVCCLYHCVTKIILNYTVETMPLHTNVDFNTNGALVISLVSYVIAVMWRQVRLCGVLVYSKECTFLIL